MKIILHAMIGIAIAVFVAGAYLALAINPHALTWLIAAAANFYLAVFVFHKNRASIVNRMFALLNVAIAAWCLNAFELYIVPDVVWAARVSAVFFLGTSFVPSLFFHFILHLTRTREDRWMGRMLYLSYAFSAIFVVLDMSGLFVNEYIYNGWKYAPRPESPYLLWILNMAFWMMFSLVHVFRAYRRARSVRVRVQLQYFFLASFIGFIFSFENYFVSLGMAVYPLGGVFTSLYMAVVAYSIVKHQLMDIKVVIRQSIVYAALTLAVAGIYALVVASITGVIGTSSRTSHGWFANGLAGAIIAAVFLPLRTWIQDVVDRFFYREKYNYQKTLKSFSEHLTSILEADLLFDMLMTRIMETMHIDRGYVLTLDTERDLFRVSFARGMLIDGMDGFSIDRGHALARWFEKHKHVFVLDESDIVFPVLARQGIVLSLPMIIRGKLIGILNLGSKMSEDMYTGEDIELLTTLANHAAIALENAELSAKMRAMEKDLYRADKLTALGTFASGVAHEIKNPLASIKTFCQLVARRFDDVKFVEKFNAVVPAEIERMEGVLGQLLDFGKFSGTTYGPVSIEQVIDDLVALIHHEAFRKSVHIVRVYGEAVPPVVANEEQMKQVFMNLILNAIQAMSGGGEIRIATGVSGGNVVVSVSDTGCGIPAESLGKLFKPFFTTRPDGTGLGLSIARKIIREHRGRIEVASEQNKGTTFTIHLPC